MKKLLFSSLIVFLSIVANGQIRFQITDGSQYLTGDANIQVYYLYTANGTNGTYGQPATCAMWGSYITIYNNTSKSLVFWANVTAGGSSNCGGSKTEPINGTIPPNSSRKYRVMPDFWTDINSTIGTPGFAFTTYKFQ